MKRIFLIFGLCILAVPAIAACPTKYTEVHMDNTILTTDASCPAGMTEYYTIDEMCTNHIH